MDAWFLFILSIYLGLELLGHMVTAMFNFLRNCQAVCQNDQNISFIFPGAPGNLFFPSEIIFGLPLWLSW